VPTTTGKGYQYPVEADPITIYPATAQITALLEDARPGVSVVTTAERNAYAGTDLWVGRIIYNTDLGQLQRYTGVDWQPAVVVEIMGDAARDALAGDALYAGRIIFNASSNQFQLYDGAVWRNGGAIPVLSGAARVALAGDDLFPGLQVYDTTAGAVFVWSGAAWVQTGVALSAVAASVQNYGDAATVGAAGTGARADHKHGMPAAPPPVSAAAIEALFTGNDQVFYGTGAGAGTLKTVAAIIASYFGAAGQLWAGTGAGGAEILAAPTGKFQALLSGGVDPSGLEWASLFGIRGNNTMQGGGTWSRDGASNLLWSNRIIVISEGRGADSAVDGYFGITIQPNGTPVPVDGGAPARNWSTAGVQLNTWEALWYKLPMGAANGTVAGNFLVTMYSNAMEPPGPDYVLIAIHNGDDDNIYTFSGNRLVLGVGQNINPGEADTSVQQRRHVDQRIDSREQLLSYTSGLLTQIVEKDSTGTVTIRTTTLSYSSGVLTQVSEVANGHTSNTFLGYTSGVLTSTTRNYT
jgi:hypothetical protein